MNLFIEDGYTLTKTVLAKPGMCPHVVAQFRPAIGRKRHEYSKVLASGDPAKIESWENDLIEQQVIYLNDDRIPKGKANRLNTEVRRILIDVVLGYEAADISADEANDLKN